MRYPSGFNFRTYSVSAVRRWFSYVSTKLKFILFAEDTNVFYTGNNLKNVIEVLNDELKDMSIWIKINKLSLNVEKTNYMIFKSKSENSV